MDDLGRQICQFSSGPAAKAYPQRRDGAMPSLLEPMVGLVSMSRICAYHVRRENCDLDELREIIDMMVASSEALLTMIQLDGRESHA